MMKPAPHLGLSGQFGGAIDIGGLLYQDGRLDLLLMVEILHHLVYMCICIDICICTILQEFLYLWYVMRSTYGHAGFLPSTGVLPYQNRKKRR